VKFSVITLHQSLPPLFSGDGSLNAVFTVNAQFVRLANQQRNFARALGMGHCVVDGQILLWAANLRARLQGLPRFEKLSGSDLVYRISAQLAQSNRRLLLIGASEAANLASVRVLQERFGVDVHGYSPPFAAYPMPREWVDNVLRVINDVRPDAIFFAFGAPKQELLISDIMLDLKACGVGLVMGVGGSLDFVSGNIRRAPRWIQRAGLEGLYRLVQQPSLMRVRRITESIAAIRYFFE